MTFNEDLRNKKEKTGLPMKANSLTHTHTHTQVDATSASLVRHPLDNGMHAGLGGMCEALATEFLKN